MAKVLVQHDTDPGIVMILEQVHERPEALMPIWRGECTQCGERVRGTVAESAIERSRVHVDEHEDAR